MDRDFRKNIRRAAVMNVSRRLITSNERPKILVLSCCLSSSWG